MTTILLPREFSSDTNYATGSASGTVTKTDPGAALVAQGIIPGVAMAQHINYVLNEVTKATREAQLKLLEQRALALRNVNASALSITDTAESCGAVSIKPSGTVIVMKTAQALRLGDAPYIIAQGVPASITSLVTDAATNGTRIIAIGTGGNRNTFSDDNGATWASGGDIGVTPRRLVYNTTYDSWIATVSNAITSRYSTDDGATWGAPAGVTLDLDAGLAVVANGNTFGINSVNALRISTDGGANWAGVSGGAVPNSGSLDDPGTVVGNGGSVFYHCGRFTSGTRLQVASSADAVTWTLLATLTAPNTTGFQSRPRIMMCQTTGLMVIAAPLTDSRCLLYASYDLGVTWTAPKLIVDPGVNAFAVAGGRLIYAHDAMLMASDGVGAL